jgi:hypothetical protein
MLYQITYTIPGRGTVSSRGHTEEGKQQLMTAVLRAGGTGVAIPQETALERLIARGLASPKHS